MALTPQWPARGTGYVKPVNAIAPQGNVSIDRVLIDGGEEDVSIARGAWNNKACLLIRWNGSATDPNGFPNPRGNPAWHVIPEWMNSHILSALSERMTDELSQKLRDPGP